jgi:alanine-synthesizing transaminase
MATIGSKEGFSHLCLALLGPGDACLTPDPAFPIHVYGPAMAGAEVVQIALGADDQFLDRVDAALAGHKPTPKMLILNYPHNPTSLTIDLDFWKRAVAICRRHGTMLISDFAYGEVNFDGYRAPSVLEAPGAKELAVEFTTMSKSYNMAGWRIGFCAGNPDMVKALGTIKGYYDYGIFAPVQISAIIAMRHHLNQPREQSLIYARRRDTLCRGLDRLGWTYQKPRDGMFVWARVAPQHLQGQRSIDFTLRMMDEAEVALSPGRAFGPHGEDHVRIAVVENEQRLKQALHNLEGALLHDKPRTLAS